MLTILVIYNSIDVAMKHGNTYIYIMKMGIDLK